MTVQKITLKHGHETPAGATAASPMRDPTADRLTAKQFEALRDALETDFRQLCLACDAATNEACKAYEANEGAAGMQLSAYGAALAAILAVRFPEGARLWFGRT